MVVALALVPTLAPAQTHIRKAIKDFAADDKYADRMLREITTKPDEEGLLDSDYRVYTMLISAKEKAIYERLKAELKKDADESYRVYEHPAGAQTAGKHRVGSDNRHYRTFGVFIDADEAYACFRDPQNPAKRYIYALSLNPQEKSDKYELTVSEIYGDDPQMKPRSTATTDNLTFNWDGLRDGLQELTRQTATLDLSALDSLTNYLGSDEFKQLYKDKVSLYLNQEERDKVDNDLAFMECFGKLRNCYMTVVSGNDFELAPTNFANRIVKLCSQYGSLIDSQQRQLCIETLDDMIAATKDKYLKGLLKSAQSKLRSK